MIGYLKKNDCDDSSTFLKSLPRATAHKTRIKSMQIQIQMQPWSSAKVKNVFKKRINKKYEFVQVIVPVIIMIIIYNLSKFPQNLCRFNNAELK